MRPEQEQHICDLPRNARLPPHDYTHSKHSSQRTLCYVLFMYTHITVYNLANVSLKSASQSNRAKEKHSPGLTLRSSHDSPTSSSVRFEGFAPRIKVEELLTAQDWGCLESQLYLPKPYVKATLSHPTPTTDISYFTVSSGTEFFQKPLILIREGKPGAARMTCHFRTNRNKNFLISNSVLSKQRNWGSRQTLARGQLNCLGGTAPQVRRGIETAPRGLDRGGSTPTSTPHSIPPPRPAASGDHQRQPETALRGAKTLSRPPGLTILSRSSPLAWSIALHVLLPGRGADRRAAWPGRSRGGAAGRTRPFPLAFQKAEKKKKMEAGAEPGKARRGRVPVSPGMGEEVAKETQARGASEVCNQKRRRRERLRPEP